MQRPTILRLLPFAHMQKSLFHDTIQIHLLEIGLKRVAKGNYSFGFRKRIHSFATRMFTHSLDVTLTFISKYFFLLFGI